MSKEEIRQVLQKLSVSERAGFFCVDPDKAVEALYSLMKKQLESLVIPKEKGSHSYPAVVCTQGHVVAGGLLSKLFIETEKGALNYAKDNPFCPRCGEKVKYQKEKNEWTRDAYLDYEKVEKLFEYFGIPLTEQESKS